MRVIEYTQIVLGGHTNQRHTLFSMLTRTSIINITKYMDTVFISYMCIHMHIYIYIQCAPPG